MFDDLSHHSMLSVEYLIVNLPLGYSAQAQGELFRPNIMLTNDISTLALMTDVPRTSPLNPALNLLYHWLYHQSRLHTNPHSIQGAITVITTAVEQTELHLFQHCKLPTDTP